MQWRCNSCGHNMSEPDTCPHCHNRICHKCKQSNSLMNISEWHRMVSDAAPDKRSSMKRKTGTGKKRKAKDPQKRIAELMANLDVK